MALRITYSAVFIRNYFQDSSSFSFRRCLPSGWTFLLFSGIFTLVSEKIFLDPDDFWRTFSIHFLVGITSFMLAAFVIYRRERTFINNIILFREHAD
uniref:Protein RFT1 homolog n=2 Tax=Solanum tuberosum TaxID=4113 RepID=M1AAY9_SOLTU